MDHKTFSAFTIKADGQQGIVESIVAVMGNADQGDDIIHNGAFVKSIQERRGKIRVLDQHQTDSIMRAIGKPLEMREVPRDQLPPDLLTQYPQATGGLYTKTQYLMDTPEGKGAFQRIAAGAVSEYSIGYDPLDVTYSKMKMPDGSEKTIRDLRTIKLYEYSPVLFGMNDATQTLSAKDANGTSDAAPAADAKDMKPWNVVHENGKWDVYKLDADGKPTGDRLGSHDNEDDARAQVRALYASENGKSDDAPEQKAGRVLAARNVTRIVSALTALHEALADAGIDMDMTHGENDTTDKPMMDEAPAGKRAAEPDADPAKAGVAALAGPTTTSPTDETLIASIEIELAELKLLEV